MNIFQDKNVVIVSNLSGPISAFTGNDPTKVGPVSMKTSAYKNKINGI